MNHARPSILIRRTGNTNIDQLYHEAEQHSEQAETRLIDALTKQAVGSAGATAEFLRCIVEQNAAALCLQTAANLRLELMAQEGRETAITLRQCGVAGCRR